MACPVMMQEFTPWGRTQRGYLYKPLRGWLSRGAGSTRTGILADLESFIEVVLPGTQRH